MESKIALVSVSDKTGLVPFCKNLIADGWDIISTGGTSKVLSDNQVVVKQVQDLTGFPEILGGRVKTLHPVIHGGILARHTEEHDMDLQKNKIQRIDLVVCNLYPFASTISKPSIELGDAIEEIDIGGVALLRAAAKNFERVIVVSSPNDYDSVLQLLKNNSQCVPFDERKRLAVKAFQTTASYDMTISNYLATKIDGGNNSEKKFDKILNLFAESVEPPLRYGENPHQSASLYKWYGEDYPFEQLQGKELSYNNILDMNAAWDVVQDFDELAISVIKHLTPCGIASGENIVEVYKKAYESDPVSAFGSIIAVNRKVTLELVEEIGKLFLEVIMSSEFTPEALEWLGKKKKNCRVIKVVHKTPLKNVIRSVYGGLLIQTPDDVKIDVSTWRVVTERKPDEKIWKDLVFAWKCVKFVKSNAIVFTQGQATVGIGCGQPNRLDCVKSAAEHAGEKAVGAVCASDAYFPFPDGIEAAASHGISIILQPGGSIRDDEVIQAANKLNLIMIFTGKRHFRH